MPSVIHCPNCDKALKVPESAQGKKTKCPKCAHIFKVPDAAPFSSTTSQESPSHADVRPIVKPEKTRTNDERNQRPAGAMSKSHDDLAEEMLPRGRRSSRNNEHASFSGPTQNSRSRWIILGSSLATVAGASLAFILFGPMLWTGKDNNKDVIHPQGDSSPPPPPIARIDDKLWKEHRSLAGRYIVLFPGTPQKQVQKIPGLDIHQTYVLLKEPGLIGFFVNYFDYAPGEGPDPKRLEQFYDETRLAFLEDIPGGKIIKEERVELQGYLGRQFTADTQQGPAMRRYFLIGNRCYFLNLGGALTGQEETVKKFFDSFQITPCLQKAVENPAPLCQSAVSSQPSPSAKSDT